MEIYPALDLLNGQCVRLKEGNFNHKTIYSKDAKSIVQAIENAGCKNLHLVDLSGAKDPSEKQTILIHQLITGSQLKIQCGGGVRSLQDVTYLLNLGADRIVLGSIAVSDPNLTFSILKEVGPNYITLALDVQIDPNGSLRIATDAWRKTSSENISDWISYYLDAGLNRILCTDISRDGMMKGPNFLLYQNLVKTFPQIQFQASGGISCLQDLHTLKKIGVHSTIIGRAFYEGAISLQEALTPC